MRRLLYILTILYIITISISLPIISSSSSSSSAIYITFTLRDYYTDEPLYNVTAEVTLSASGLGTRTFKLATNITGLATVVWKGGSISPGTIPRLTSLRLSIVNVTKEKKVYPLLVMKICKSLLEFEEYVTAYFDTTMNMSVYEDLDIPLDIMTEGNMSIIRCDVWVLRGKVVNISAYDPLENDIAELYVKPGLPISGISAQGFEIPYVLPLNYPVLIKKSRRVSELYPVLQVWITNETDVVPWTYHVAKALVERKLGDLKASLRWFIALGYPISEEVASLDLINALSDQALFLFEKRNYTAAVGVMINLIRVMNESTDRLESFKSSAFLSSFLMFTLLFGFSIVITTLFLPTSKFKNIVGVAIFLGFLGTLILLQPSARVASAVLLSSLGVSIAAFDYFVLAAATIVFGSIIYCIYLLFVLVTRPAKKLTLSLALQYLRARKWRSLLLIITLALVIASSIAIMRVSLSTMLYTSELKSDLNIYGLDIRVNTFFKREGLTEYELYWIKGQVNYIDEGIIRAPSTLDYAGVLLILPGTRGGGILLRGVALSPSFMSKYFHLNVHVPIGRLPLDKEYGILLPSTYLGIFRLGSEVKVYLAKVSETTGNLIPVRPITPRTLRVVGFFDPVGLKSVKGPDGEPLFEDPETTVIIPVNIDLDKDLVITRVFLLTNSDIGLDYLASQLVKIFPARITVMSGISSRVYEYVRMLTLRGLNTTLILVIMASLLISSVMFDTVEERKRDYSTLAILGGNPSDLFSIILVETLIVGFISSFLGWILGVPVAVLSQYGIAFLGEYVGALKSATLLPIQSALVALFLGVVVTFFSGVIPAAKAQRFSLMGRKKRKIITSADLRIEGDIAKYTLPLRVSIFETNLLYRFLKMEIVPKKDFLGEEVYLDGTFSISFAMSVKYKGTSVSCRLKTIRRGDILLLELQVPKEYKDYIYFSDVVYNIETKILHYPEWKSQQLRYLILRKAPSEEVITLDSLLERALKLLQDIEDMRNKLDKLESMKHKISSQLYMEYQERYKRNLNSLYRSLRAIGMRLEPFYKQLRDEISKLNSELERINVAYELGELKQEEYEKKANPLKEALQSYMEKANQVERVFRALKTPLRTS